MLFPRRIIWFAIASICLVTFFSGCKTPQPEKTQAAVIPPPPAALPSAPTNAILVPASKPRPPAESADNIASNILAWDAVSKTSRAEPGEDKAEFVFSMTNVSPQLVMIYDTSTTCDCTVAKLPSTPWPVAPGKSGQIQATIDLKGRIGAVTNYVIVFTSKGNKMLTLHAFSPTP
ncbi:MAG: hypothetical protein QOD03_64 [Verrucomicrobiota bacterium]|jgi:hypothetical protein